MALTTLNLQVSFTATYVGEHRVCWRVVGTIPYDCTTLVIATLGANVTVITFDVEENYCGPYEFEGYVQPTCFTEGDPSGQTAWTPVQYVNTPDCIGYLLTCSTVSIERIDITGYGSGYDPTPGNEPLVTIAGDATAIAIVEATNDGIKSASINTPGAGYFGGGNGKAINITATTAGPGIDARFDVEVLSGAVSKITLRSGGTLWSLVDQFSFNNADLGGSGAGFIGDVDSLSVIGEIKEIQLTFVGTNYVGIPVLTIDPPVGPGTQATAVARLAGCQALTQAEIGPNCDLTARADTGVFGLGDTLHICNSTPPPGGYPAGWTEATSGCCYGTCESYTAEAFVGPPTGYATVYYTDCATGQLTWFDIGGAAPGTNDFCAILGTVSFVLHDGVVTVTDNGPCVT